MKRGGLSGGGFCRLSLHPCSTLLTGPTLGSLALDKAWPQPASDHRTIGFGLWRERDLSKPVRRLSAQKENEKSQVRVFATTDSTRQTSHKRRE